MDLESIRKSIDEIDDEILSLFIKRMNLSELAINEKLNLGKNLRDEERESQIINDIIEKSGNYRRYSKILFEVIMSLSRHKQLEILKENSKIDKIFNLSHQFEGEIEDFKNLWIEDIYGLLGKKLSHSFSLQIHKKIDNHKYELIEKDENEVEDFILSKSYRGLNITIPYKKIAMKCCDELSETAKKIGAINTIVNRNGSLYGDNTDYYGLISMFKSANIDLENKKILILGDGATSNTAVIALQDMGVREIIKASRKISSIQKNISNELNKNSSVSDEKLKKEIEYAESEVSKLNSYINQIDIKTVSYDDYNEFKDCDIIVNCTSVGMYPDNLQSLIDLDVFNNLIGVCDVVYNPLNTKIILDAKKRNIKTSEGLRMLVSQAIYSAELFNDKKYEYLEDEILNELKKEMSNIVLIGMPGSGKTSIGKEVSKLSGKKFVDIDELIEIEENMKISEIFEKFGEKYFRQKEKDMIIKVSKEHNQVISTGGGCVLDDYNYYPLKQNGVIFYIDRDIKDLSIDSRPLSKGGIQTLEKLFEIRQPLYLNFSDKIVKNIGIINTSNKIMEAYDEIFNY